MREDAIQVYLRHRDSLYGAILKSSDYEEEAQEYQDSVVNLMNHDIPIPQTEFDRVCLGVIAKSKKEKDIDKQGKGAVLGRFAASEVAAHRHQKTESPTNRLLSMGLDALGVPEASGGLTVEEMDVLHDMAMDKGYTDFFELPQETDAEIAEKTAMLSQVIRAGGNPKRDFATPAGSHYTTVNKREQMHSEWPSLDPDTAAEDGMHFWHPSVHPLRMKNTKTGLSQMAHLLKDFVYKDDWDGGQSMAERHGDAILNHERTHKDSPVIRGLDKSLGKTKEAFIKDKMRLWRQSQISEEYPKGIPAEFRSELKREDFASKKEYERAVANDPEPAKKEQEAVDAFNAMHTADELDAEFQEAREATNPFLGSVTRGTQGNHLQHLLYERAFNEWKRTNPEAADLPESTQRDMHMREAMEKWDSDDFQSSGMTYQDASREQRDKLDELAFLESGEVSFNDLQTNDKQAALELMNRVVGDEGETKKHAHGLGYLGYMLGLEWLQPEDRTKVIDHIMEHGLDTHQQQEITLGDKSKIPVGLLKRNFLSRFMPEFLATQRRGSSTAPNRAKHIESDFDVSESGVARQMEHSATHNAILSVLPNEGEQLHEFLRQMAGHAPGGNKTMPLLGIRNTKKFKDKVKEFASGKHKSLLTEDGEIGEPHPKPVEAAMRHSYESSVDAGKTPEKHMNFDDFLRMVGWRQDKDGNLSQVEQHQLFDEWSPDHPTNLSLEQVAAIRDARNSFLGFSRMEKDLRNSLGPFRSPQGVDEDEDGHYIEDEYGVPRGLGDFFARHFEGGGHPMSDTHFLQAIATMLSPFEDNYEERINPKTRKREFVASDSRGKLSGLLGDLDASGVLKPRNKMMSILAHILPDVLSAYSISPVGGAQVGNPIGNILSFKDTSSPLDPHNPDKKKPRNNKNNASDFLSTSAHDLHNAKAAMNADDLRDAIENSRAESAFMISPASMERNSKFTDNPATAIGISGDYMFGEQKARDYTHDHVRTGTSMGVKNIPGLRWSQDANGIWRKDPNGKLFLGSPFSHLSTEQMMLLDGDDRTAFFDSDGDFRHLLDDTGLSQLMGEMDELKEPKTVMARTKEGELIPIETRGKSEYQTGGSSIPVPQNDFGFKTLGELRSALAEIEIAESEGSQNYWNASSKELSELESAAISGFVEKKQKEFKGTHESLEADLYNKSKKSMHDAVVKVASVLRNDYLKMDPTAFDTSDPNKFIANHASLMQDAETLLMHLPHEDVAAMMPDGEGLKVLSPTVGVTRASSMEEAQGESPHYPIANLMGMNGTAYVGASISNEFTPEEICDAVGLDKNNKDHMDRAKKLLYSLPKYKDGDEPVVRRVATIGQLLDIDSKIANQVNNTKWHGMEDNTYHFGHDWTKTSLDDIKRQVEQDAREANPEFKGTPTELIRAYGSEANDVVRNHPAMMSIRNMMTLFQRADRTDLERHGMDFHFRNEGKRLKHPNKIGHAQHYDRIASRLDNLITFDPQVPPPGEKEGRSVPHVTSQMVELHPGRHGRVMGGASMIPFYNNNGLRVIEGTLMQPSVKMNVEATGLTFGTQTGESHYLFPSHDTYESVHGADTSQQLVSAMEDPNHVSQFSYGQSIGQRTSTSQPISPSEEDPSIFTRSRPTTISGLLLKDLPKEMPLIEPLHKIFEIDDLRQLRGFTGEWVVSVFYEGERVKVKRRKNSLTITDTEHNKFGIDDEMRKSLRKLCKHDYTIDGVVSDGKLYINDIMYYEGNDVTDMSTRERVKLLRGQFDSHEDVIVPSPSTLKMTDETGLELSVKSLLEENKDAKLLLRDAKSSYMKGEEKHPKWILMTKSDDDFHIPFGMEIDDDHFILHFADDLVKYDIIDDSPQNPISAIAGFTDSDYPIRLAKSLERFWMPAFGQMLKESKRLQQEMSPKEMEEESAGIIKPKDEDRIKKPKKYLEALLRLEKRLDDFEKGHYPMSGSKGMYFDVESPRGPTELVHPSALPDYDMLEPEGQELEGEEDYPGKRRKAAESADKEEELESFGNL